MANPRSRYELVSRRAILKGSLGAGALALVPSLACGGGNDAEVFAGARAAPETPATAPPLEQTVDANASATPQPQPAEAASDAADQESGVETTNPSDVVASALPVGAMLVVDFSYVQGSGGKNLPPYVAVWVEDSNGDLVETVELWYQQDIKGPRWLPDLKRWFSVNEVRVEAGTAERVDVISGATRLAGAYSVGWDGILPAGPAVSGDYFICVESRREGGPYSLIREAIALNGTPFEQPLTPDGELQTPNVAVRV